MSASDDLPSRICQWLDGEGASYTVKRHEPTYTSEQSALARGEPLRVGAKALLVKADEQFRLLVLPADRKLGSQAARRELGARSLRFATREELAELTGLEPGAVPPFGQPILPFELSIDAALRDNDKVAFNAGSLTMSIIMPADAYFRVAAGSVQQCAQPP